MSNEPLSEGGIMVLGWCFVRASGGFFPPPTDHCVQCIRQQHFFYAPQQRNYL